MSAEERNRAEAKWLPIWLPVAVCAALLLTGCYDSMETQRSPNGFEAQLIGYVDGCRVWDLQGDKARAALLKVRAHTGYLPGAANELLAGLLDSVARISDEAIDAIDAARGGA